MITEHPHSFESFACAMLDKPGGGVRRQLGGTPSLDWDSSLITGSRSAGNIVTSAAPDDNLGRQIWRRFSLLMMKIKWTAMFKKVGHLEKCKTDLKESYPGGIFS